MKKTIIALMAVLAGAASVSAQDTLTVNNPSEVQVIKDAGSLSVSIRGLENDPGYSYSASLEAGPSAVLHTQERMSQGRFDLSVPLFTDDPDPSESRRGHGGVDLAIGLGFGISVPSNLTDPDYYPMRQAWGLDFSMGILEAYYHPWGNEDRLFLNFGLEDKSFKIRGDERYVKAADGVLGFDDFPGRPKWSALRVFSWNISAGYYQHIYKNFGLFVEPILNINTSSRIKTKWYDDRDKVHKEKVKFCKQRLITYELMGGVTIANVKLYVKYNPCNLIDKAYGPEFTTWSFGIIL